MQSKKLAGSKPQATQKYLDIAEIRDDCVVLKDGTLRAVLLVSSVNFALKSEDEQNAVISGYVSFLNSFEFPIQILIQSRRLNIDSYLEKLKKIEKEQTNELLKMQTGDYRQFISELLELEQIMSKRFYVVIPLNPLTSKQKGFWSRFYEAFSAGMVIRLKEKQFQERKKELFSRVGLASSGLNSMGLSSVVLNTQSLIELYYNSYNPVVSEQERMVEIGKTRTEE